MLSTLSEKSFPKESGFTLEVVRAVSEVFCPAWV